MIALVETMFVVMKVLELVIVNFIPSLPPYSPPSLP